MKNEALASTPPQLRDAVAARVLEHLRSKLPEMTQLLTELVLAESPSSEPSSHAAVFDLLEQRIQTLDFKTRRISSTKSGGQLFCYPNGNRHKYRQLLLGHCDTVWPLRTVREMPVKEEEGRLYGPGVYDMKAGLVQMVFACEAIAALGRRPVVTPMLFITSDEEIGSHDSRQHLERLARIADRVFVLEPSLGPDGKLKTARKGIGRFSIRVVGRAAHAGLDPEKGASAILELSVVIQKLFALNGLVEGVTVNVGKIDGGLRPNVVAPESSAVVDVRAPTHQAAQRVEAEIRAIRPTTPDTQLLVDGGFGRPPMEQTPACRALWRRACNAAEALDLTVGEATAGGGSDGNFTNQFTPTLDGLGAVGGGAHATHENVVLDSLPERTALLTLLMLDPPLDLS